MKEWILSIVVTVILISVFSFIIPTGKNGKLIKALFHVALVFVILKPLANNEINFNNLIIFNQIDMEIQNSFIDGVNSKKINIITEDCVKILENNGVRNPDIKILYVTEDNQNITIQKVVVNLENSVIISTEMNIDIIDRTKSLICNNLNIEEDLVEVYV